METNSKIGFAEALSVLLIVILSHLVLTLPKTFLQNQGSGGILNVIYITLLALFVIFVLNLLYKNFKGMDILDISGFLFGKCFKFIIGIGYIVYLLIISSVLLRNSSENLKTIYFQSTPIPYILFFILIAVGFINKYNLKTVIKCNLIVVPLAIIAQTILFLFSFDSFVFERFFPILGYGVKNTFLFGATNIFVFGNILFLFFIMPLLKDYKQFKKLSYTSVLISGLFILLTILALTLMFPLNISSVSNSPMYLQTNQITFGTFIQRVDAFFVLVWIITILSYLSIVIGFIVLIFQKITNIQDKSTVLYCFIAILFGISMIYSNVIQIRQLETHLLKYYELILVLGVGLIILLLANIKNKRNKNNIKGEFLSEKNS